MLKSKGVVKRHSNAFYVIDILLGTILKIKMQSVRDVRKILRVYISEASEDRKTNF